MAQPLTRRSLDYNHPDLREIRQGIYTQTALHEHNRESVGLCRKWNCNCCEFSQENCKRLHLCMHCLVDDGHAARECDASEEMCETNCKDKAALDPSKGKGRGKGRFCNS